MTILPGRVRFFYVLVLTGFTLIRPAAGQVVTFPDPNLEAAVRQALQIPMPTPIYRTNMLVLTNLFAGYNGITNLSGLQYATNQTLLDIPGSPLSDISVVTNLPRLTWLNIAFDQVLDTSKIAGLTNLVHLDLGGNSDGNNHYISNVTSVAGLHSLQWLSLYGLQVHDVSPLGGLHSLTNLDINFNQFVTNPPAFSGLTNLVELDIAGDTITNVVFATPLANLRHLDMGFDSVSNLSPLVSVHLTDLLAHYNPITNASVVTNMPTLHLLTLGGDNLTNLAFLAGRTNLQDLSVDANPAPNIMPLLGLTNLTRLNINGNSFTNLASVSNMLRLTELDMNSIAGLNVVAFLSPMTNLLTLDISYDRVGDVSPLRPLGQLQNLYAQNNLLTDISPLTNLTSIGYVNVQMNLLDTNSASASVAVVQQLNDQGTFVDFLPQNVSPTISISAQPSGDCIQPGQMAGFSVVASTSAGTLAYQWQLNDVDLPGRTSSTLLLTSATTNQAGHYRVILTDDNGEAATEDAILYVGDPTCGRTISILLQPINQCAAPGDEVLFQVLASSTRTNLFYQWQFNGTNLLDETNSTLDLPSVDSTQAGFYDVVLMDDRETNYSETVELKVVTNVVFPNSVLDQAVRSNLGLGPSDPIPLSTLDSLNDLEISSSGVTDLSGLECARYLYSLDLSYNSITNVQDIAWLQNLSWLRLVNCGLTSIEFLSGLTNLYSLDVSTDQGQPNQNQINDVSPLAGLLNLQYLTAGWNACPVGWFKLDNLTKITWLSIPGDCVNDAGFVGGMVGLTLLDLGNNSVTDSSPVSNKVALTWLSLSWNQITNSPLSRLTNLNTLYIGGNPLLKNVGFLTNMPLLQWIGIDHSGVTNISSVAGLTNAQYLDTSYTAATNLSAVSNLTALGTLWAGGNNAGTASFVSRLTNVAYLGLESDAVTDLSPLAGHTNLFYFTAENNQLTNVAALTNNYGLNSLYLRGNQIHSLAPLAGLTNVNSLSLGGNGLSDISPLASLKRLNWLTMESNLVQNLGPLSSLTNLQNLDVSWNQVTNLAPVAGLSPLTFLYPAFNRLASLPSLAALTNLTSLDCTGNQLTNISGLSGMPALNWASFRINQLKSLPNLTGLPALRTLDFTTNFLTDASGVSGLTGLTFLSLNYNNLQNITPLTSLTSLGYIDLRLNLLDTNQFSAAMTAITTMQSHGTFVDYVPQKTSPSSILLTGPVWLGTNRFGFTISSQPGVAMQVLVSSNLTFWSSIGSLTNTNGSVPFTDSAATNKTRFYRAQQM
jgi:internalin A